MLNRWILSTTYFDYFEFEARPTIQLNSLKLTVKLREILIMATPNTKRALRFRIALKRMRREGVRYYGDPEDPCVVVKCYKKYKVDGERFKLLPRVIAYFAEFASRPSRKGKKTEISHLCGRKGCIVSGHYKCELKQKNLGRRWKCHKRIKSLLRFFDGIGKKVTLEMLGGVCPHEPKCFYNSSEFFKD